MLWQNSFLNKQTVSRGWGKHDPNQNTNVKACGELTSSLSPEMESDKTAKQKDYIEGLGKK